MAQRTPLRQKQAFVAPDSASRRVGVAAVKGRNSPRLDMGLDKKRKLPVDIVNLCSTSEQAVIKLTSPPSKRVKHEFAPAVPMLERGKKTKARQAKDEALRDGISGHREQWQRSYRRAFPSFVFYFDAIDGAKREELVSYVLALGARTESFFSKTVTNVVTSRPVPTESVNKGIDFEQNKENMARDASAPRTVQGMRKASPIKGSGHDQDVLVKASNLNIKIWDQRKFLRMVHELLDVESPRKAALGNATVSIVASAKGPSLPMLLREEQLSGMTRERDPEVLRTDFHYFSSKAMYVIVEDSTAVHRPILIKEYARARKNEDVEWPVLYGGAEGRPAFSRAPGAPKAPPVVPILLPLGLKGKADMANPAHLPTINLRRAVSLNELQKRVFAEHKAGGDGCPTVESNSAMHRHECSGFLAASGVPASSNAAASITSGAPSAANVSYGPLDARLADLARRQSVWANGRLNSSGLLSQFGVRGPGVIKRSISMDTGLNLHARGYPPKPGYCENCRLRYDDFREHTRSRKHREFATKNKHWTALDNLLRTIERPLRPEVVAVISGNVPLQRDLRAKLHLPELAREALEIELEPNYSEGTNESSSFSTGCEDDEQEN